MREILCTEQARLHNGYTQRFSDKVKYSILLQHVTTYTDKANIIKSSRSCNAVQSQYTETVSISKSTHLAAALGVGVFQHLLAHEDHHLLGGEHVEQPVAGQQQELVVVADRRHLHTSHSRGQLLTVNTVLLPS
jgi:hypothetical protein